MEGKEEGRRKTEGRDKAQDGKGGGQGGNRGGEINITLCPLLAQLRGGTTPIPDAWKSRTPNGAQ